MKYAEIVSCKTGFYLSLSVHVLCAQLQVMQMHRSITVLSGLTLILKANFIYVFIYLLFYLFIFLYGILALSKLFHVYGADQ